jgi:hypothetical protein
MDGSLVVGILLGVWLFEYKPSSIERFAIDRSGCFSVMRNYGRNVTL